MASATTNNRTILIALLLTLLGAIALTLVPGLRAADFTAANEAELVTAIIAANAAGAGDHSIALTADVTLTAPLPALDNTAATGITLDGAGHTLDADGAGTALVVLPNTTLTVQNLTITGGDGSSGPGGQSGGGIFNRGALTVLDSTITGNVAARGAGIFTYAGEFGAASLTLSGVTLSDNDADDTGGGLAATGDTGAVTIDISDAVISGNSAGNYGGGLATDGHSGSVTVTIANTTIADNAGIYGGGIFNNGNSGEAILSLDRVTLSGNSVTNSGGALYNNGNKGTATAVLVNSTLSGNSAAKNGGGIANSSNSGTAKVTLHFVTVAANDAKTGSGLYASAAAVSEAQATIFAAGAQGAACVFGGAAALASGGYNLDTDESCALSATGDVSGGDPALASLALNAPGETATHALGEGDAQRRIPTGAAGCGTDITTDQRGAARPFPGALCDIGAYESDAEEGGTPGTTTATATTTATPTQTATPTTTVTGTPPTITPTVTGTPPTPTATVDPGACVPPYQPATDAALRAAILCVNAAGVGNHLISLAADITLAAPLPALDNEEAGELIFDGDGHLINGAQKGTVLVIAAGTSARVRDLTITGGSGSSGPTGDWGGAIFNRGSLTIENSALSGNTAAYGGGVVNYADAIPTNLTILRSTLSGNAGTVEGGAVHNTAINGGSALLNMMNVTVSSNFAGAGGGLFNEADGGNAGANTVYATFANNAATADEGGGGIHNVIVTGNASVTLSATIISNGQGGSPDCARPSGAIISTGYNLDGDDTCNLTQGNDQPAVNVGLLSLAFNAPGTTATHALSPASPAVDNVHNGGAGCGTALTTDQRGAPRPAPAGGMCDSGAFELQDEVIAPEYLIYLPVGIKN